MSESSEEQIEGSEYENQLDEDGSETSDGNDGSETISTSAIAGICICIILVAGIAVVLVLLLGIKKTTVEVKTTPGENASETVATTALKDPFINSKGECEIEKIRDRYHQFFKSPEMSKITKNKLPEEMIRMFKTNYSVSLLSPKCKIELDEVHFEGMNNFNFKEAELTDLMAMEDNHQAYFLKIEFDNTMLALFFNGTVDSNISTPTDTNDTNGTSTAGSIIQFKGTMSVLHGVLLIGHGWQLHNLAIDEASRNASINNLDALPSLKKTVDSVFATNNGPIERNATVALMYVLNIVLSKQLQKLSKEERNTYCLGLYDSNGALVPYPI